MMLLELLFSVVLGVLALWLIGRASLLGKSEGDLRSALLPIDLVALRNLLREEDDAFLMDSLSRGQYRAVRRVRTRALQQYLRWIAANCATTQLLLRLRTQAAQDTARTRYLAASSFRLRLVALGLWSSLWLQWAFPEFDLMPGSLISTYEDFATRMHVHVATLQNGPAVNTGNTL